MAQVLAVLVLAHYREITAERYPSSQVAAVPVALREVASVASVAQHPFLLETEAQTTASVAETVVSSGSMPVRVRLQTEPQSEPLAAECDFAQEMAEWAPRLR